MTRAEKYAQWIINNKDKKGTHEFEKVAEAYKAAKLEESESVSGGKTYKGLDIVKETGDGGIVLRAPNGGLTYVNEQAGYSTSDPQKIEQMMGGTGLKEQLTKSFDEQTLEQAPVSSRAIELAKGIPFVGKAIGEATPESRLATGAMERQNPVESAGLQLAGGLLGSVPLAMSAPAALAGRGLLATTGLGALGGAIEGGVYEGLGGGDVVKGATYGGIGGSVAGLAGSLFGKAYNVWQQSKADKAAYGKIAEILGVSDDAAKVIGKVWADGVTDPKEVSKAIARAGERGLIADADVAAAQLLDAAKSSGSEAARVVDRAVNKRVKEGSRGVMASLDVGLGDVPKTAGGMTMDLDSMVQSVYKQSEEARNTAYSKALNTIIDYSSPKGQRIEQVFNNVIPERIRKAAVQDAAERMQISEKDYRQLLLALKPDGTIDVSQLPDMRMLDELKKSIGNLAFSKNEFGMFTDDALKLQPAYYKLRNAMNEAVPSYKTATDLGADTIAQREALSLGMDAFKNNVRPVDLAKNMARLDPAEREMVKRGARISLDETMANVRKTISGLNSSMGVDQLAGSIEEVQQLWKNLSSRTSRDKLKVLMGEKEVDSFMRQLDQLQVAYALKVATNVNSKTAQRMLTNQTIEDITSLGPIGNLLRGEPAVAVKSVLQEVTGMSDAAMTDRGRKILVDVAKGLTKLEGQEARKAANTIVKLVADKRVSDSELQQAYDMIMKSALGGSIGMATHTGEMLAPEF